MTQIYGDNGEPVCVTVVQAGPCVVVQKKNKAKDGYDAICVGFETVEKESKVRKPQAGSFKKAGTKAFRYIREFTPNKIDDYNVGSEMTVAIFKKGDKIEVAGVTKGKGFQGVMKRCNFKGGPSGHGSKFHRTSGSVGMRTSPGRVLPGQGMAGQMGNSKVTIKNLKIFDVNAEKNLLFVTGALPGGKNGLVVVSSRNA